MSSLRPLSSKAHSTTHHHTIAYYVRLVIMRNGGCFLTLTLARTDYAAATGWHADPHTHTHTQTQITFLSWHLLIVEIERTRLIVILCSYSFILFAHCRLSWYIYVIINTGVECNLGCIVRCCLRQTPETFCHIFFSCFAMIVEVSNDGNDRIDGRRPQRSSSAKWGRILLLYHRKLMAIREITVFREEGKEIEREGMENLLRMLTSVVDSHFIHSGAMHYYANSENQNDLMC